MRKEVYRTVLDVIAGVLATNPQADDAVVMLEGWSDEKQAVVDFFSGRPSILPLPVTVPPTPSVIIDNERSWSSAGGAGALLWQDAASPTVPATVHPYLDTIVLEYRPL